MSEAKRNRILTAARAVFLRHGYRRVSMNDIAAAADVSRPALYLVFKNKEDIFTGVYWQWVDETLAEVERAIAAAGVPKDKLQRAFEIWSVRPFEIVLKSPEARELLECGFAFAEVSMRQGYKKFEATITPVLASIAEVHPRKTQLPPAKKAHILAGAVRGFKLTATTPAALRLLIKDLLTLTINS